LPQRVGFKHGLTVALMLASSCTVPSYRREDVDGGHDVDCRSCARPDGSAVLGARLPLDAAESTPLLAELDGAPSAAPGDAELASSPPSSDAWPDSVLGTYAIRMRFFGNDVTLSSLAYFSHEKIALAVTTRASTSDSVSMKFTICRDQAKLQSPLSADLIATTVSPEKLEPVLFTLVEHDGVFNTEADPRFIGYDELAPAECGAVSKAPSRAQQTWLSGAQCDCVATAEPPTKPSDCRVTDADGDGKPGITVRRSGSSTGEDYVRFRDQSQLSAVTIRADGRHSGLWLENNDYYVLQCTNGLCPRVAYRACKPEVNPALFARLAESSPLASAWTCDEMLKLVDSGHLFPNDMLAYPDDC
jgi:hypothetical protein